MELPCCEQHTWGNKLPLDRSSNWLDYANTYNYENYYRHRLDSSFKDTATIPLSVTLNLFTWQGEKWPLVFTIAIWLNIILLPYSINIFHFYSYQDITVSSYGSILCYTGSETYPCLIRSEENGLWNNIKKKKNFIFLGMSLDNANFYLWKILRGLFPLYLGQL